MVKFTLPQKHIFNFIQMRIFNFCQMRRNFFLFHNMAKDFMKVFCCISIFTDENLENFSKNVLTQIFTESVNIVLLQSC